MYLLQIPDYNRTVSAAVPQPWQVWELSIALSGAWQALQHQLLQA